MSTPEVNTCRDCGGRVLWARTEAGKRIRLDPEPHSDGNIRLWETASGKLLAFYRRWFPARGYDFAAPAEGTGLYASAKEWFGLFVSHRCASEAKSEAREGRRS